MNTRRFSDPVDTLEDLSEYEHGAYEYEGTKPARRANAGLFTSDKSDWGTPQWLFDLLNAEFQFDVDVCADANNTKCPMYYDKEADGLAREWADATYWLNPPYGNEAPKWIKKAFESALHHNATVVCLVAARTDTRWWWNYCRRGEVRFLPGRLRFEVDRQPLGPATFPSAVVIFRAGNIQARTVYWEVRAK